jgi:hypothetical protein
VPLFDIFFGQERASKANTPYAFVPHTYEPFCYHLNVKHSPYDESPLPHLVPNGRPIHTPIPPIGRPDAVSERLFRSTVAPSIKCVPEEGRKLPKKDLSAPKPLVPPTRASYSQRLARGAYRNQPFTYGFIDRLRERANRDLSRSQQG